PDDFRVSDEGGTLAGASLSLQVREVPRAPVGWWRVGGDVRLQAFRADRESADPTTTQLADVVAIGDGCEPCLPLHPVSTRWGHHEGDGGGVGVYLSAWRNPRTNPAFMGWTAYSSCRTVGGGARDRSGVRTQDRSADAGWAGCGC